MLSELITTVTTFLLGLIDSWGYIGIFILMTIESSFIPFPAELIMIPAGALVATNQMNFTAALFAGTLGSVAGAYINYLIAYYIGRKGLARLLDKYGKYVFLNKAGLKKTDEFFAAHGPITTFVGRLIPGVRSFVSFPAGFTKMNLVKFFAYTGLGAGIWCVVLLCLGYVLQSNTTLISKYLSEISYITIGVCAIIITVYVWNHRRKSKSSKS